MMPLIRVPIGAVESSIDAMERVGFGAREVALFWLGDAATLTVSAVVLPVGRGVVWESHHLHLDEVWMLRLTDLCDKLDVVVLGGVHSHPLDAFMSGVDHDAFFHAPDFVSVVLPDYGRTSIEDATRSWSIYAGLPGNEWRPGSWADDVEVVAGEASVIELGGPDVQGAR
jgi:hypothetical protein